jgi:hypothetical protein
MPMSVACPSCKSKLKIPDAMVGMDRTLNCPACKTPLNVRQLTTQLAGSTAPAPHPSKPTAPAQASPPAQEGAFDNLDLMPEHKPASSPQPTTLAPSATAPLPVPGDAESGKYDDLDLAPESKPAPPPVPAEEVYEEFEIVEDEDAKEVEPIEELEAVEEVEAIEEVAELEEVEAVEEVHAVEEVVDHLETVDDEGSKKKKKRTAVEEKPNPNPKPTTEMKPPPSPAADKPPATKLEKSLLTPINLLKIRVGMSLSDVEAILGPGTVIDRLVIGNNERKIVIWLDGKGRGFQTTFVNDKNSFGF